MKPPRWLLEAAAEIHRDESAMVIVNESGLVEIDSAEPVSNKAIHRAF